MVQLKWQYTVTLGFIICSVLLLAIIAFQVHYARQYREQIITEINNVKSSGFVLDAMPVLPEDNKPVVAYTDFVERPLFFSDRRPVVMDIAETEKEQQVKVCMLYFKILKRNQQRQSFYVFRQGENQVILLTKPRNTKYKNKQNSVSRRTLNPFNRTNK